MALWDNLEHAAFEVVVNARGQHSLWPRGRKRPRGWAAVGFSGERRACLEEIDRRWDPSAPPVECADGAGPEVSDRAGPTESGADGVILRGRRRATPDVTITELIRRKDIPADRVAATYGSRRITRGELLDTSAGWARVLTELGCGREVPVAVLLPRGPQALTAILAVLDAGGAYLPLSCDQPLERTEAILRDCGASLVVTTDELAGRLSAPDRVCLTVENLTERAKSSVAVPEPASGDDLAFIFYTSGTTGEPKGVEGTHGQLVNYALWCREAFAHRPGETTFLSASLFFLGSLTTIFTPLLEGWPITVVPDGATTDALLDLSATAEGGLLKLTPTHIRMMMARGVPDRGMARQLMVGSESLTFSQDLRTWLAADPRRVVVNHYGLTETHGCFCHRLTGDEPVGSRVPIGVPIDNVEAYVVDGDGELLGVDEVGELLVGGPSLGRGYRHRPALTAERWIPHPWGPPGSRLLRTGDLARVDADGVVTVLGRADRQVKVRGHRVEPAAVEEALRATPNVREALVLPRTEDDGQVTLAAFLLHEPGTGIDPAAATTALEKLFPPQWVPARMAVLPEFPVNSHGKVDIRALPEPVPVARARAGAEATDRWTRIDRLVAEAFCDVLKIDDIGLRDSFHDLGGDSLTAVEVAARVGRALGRDVPVPSADAATVRSYAEKIGSPALSSAAGPGRGEGG